MQRRVDWQVAEDIKQKVDILVDKLELDWVKKHRVFCVRSNNSKARAYARIWGMARVWQMSLNIPPSYCIEVLSERFDHLSEDKRDKILLHEIAHIPKNFSGALLPHTKKSKGSFHDKLKTMIAVYDKL